MDSFILREVKVTYKNYRKVRSLKFTASSNVYDYWFSKLKNEAYEKMISIHLNCQNEVICFCFEAEGDISHAAVYTGKIARNALLTHAARIIFVHNHPSGVPEPSEQDIALTKNLKNGLKLLDIEVLDHVVIGDGKFYSFHDHGLI